MRHILLCLTGLNPQVVTETLYALHQQTPSWRVDELWLMTTRQGAEKARTLLSGPTGALHQLTEETGVSLPLFDPERHILIFENEQGDPLDDIRTLTDSEALADHIARILRHFCHQPDTALHVSLAGGRKTMSFYVGYLLSLYGRRQDALSHTLISPPELERVPDFFYPTPFSRLLTGPDGEQLDSRTARVTLVDIPFLRLRELLDPALLEADLPFSQLIHSLQHTLQPETVHLDLKQWRIRIGYQPVSLSPINFLFYSWVIWRYQQGQPVEMPPDGLEGDRQAAQDLLNWYSRWEPEQVSYRLHRSLETLERDGLTHSFVRDRKHRIRQQLKKALGPAGEHYAIHFIDRRHHLGFRLSAERFILKPTPSTDTT